MVLTRLSFSLNFPYIIRAIPINAAKRQGPARSPVSLDTFNADSVKADAH